MTGDGVQPHRQSSGPPRPHRNLDNECDCQQCQGERFFIWIASPNKPDFYEDPGDRSYS